MYKFRLKPNSAHVWSKEELKNSGYPNPSHEYYIVFSIDEQLTEGDFATMEFDMDKLKNLLRQYVKSNTNYDKGATAVKMSELIGCKK